MAPVFKWIQHMQEPICILSSDSNYNLAFLFHDKCIKENALRTLPQGTTKYSYKYIMTKLYMYI